MYDIKKYVEMSKTIAITGHIRPDGDCVGAVLALANFLKEQYGDAKRVDCYLETVPAAFHFLTGAGDIQTECLTEKTKNCEYDLLFVLDSGSMDRIEPYIALYQQSRTRICIDHHISNTSFCDINYVDSRASSTCELLYDCLYEKPLSRAVAECLYLGIVHDTGVFKHSNTTHRTMEVAGCLLETGVNSEQIIDDSFYRKTYMQNQILGRCLLESILIMDGKIIFSCVTKKMMQLYGAVSADLDGIVDQLRVTSGVEVAILVREEESQNYKVSMRSNGKVDVCKICCLFCGGGHAMAAGCNMNGSIHDVINNLSIQIAHQLTEGRA